MTEFNLHRFREVNPVVNPNADAVNKAMLQFSGRNLSSGADKCPVVDFIALGKEWDVKPSPFRADETFIVFEFSQLQVLKIRDGGPAHPYDIVELQIKHSGSQRSGFGFVTASINKALGIESEDSDLEQFKGKMWRVTMSMYNWGTIDGKPDMMGEIWEFSLANPSPTAGATTAPNPSTPTTVTQPAQTVEATAVAEAPVTTETNTARARALELLDGKSKDQYYPVVTVDKVVRDDEQLFLSIIQNTFLAGLEASGEVILGADGIYTVNKK